MLQRRGGKRWLGGVAGSLLVLSLGGMMAVPASGAAVASGTVPAAGTVPASRTAVARPTGPYVDESGTPMTAGGGTQILASHGHVIGPGGQSVMHDAGGDLLVYHYYAANANGTPEPGITL